MSERRRRATQENLPEEVQKIRCTAHSSRTGNPCQRPPIKGGTVCFHHGGAAPQVKKAAKIRLENASDRLAAALLDLAETCPDPRVRLAAIRDALDRAGVREGFDVTVKKWEEAFDAATVTVIVDGDGKVPRHERDRYATYDPEEDD